MKFLLIQVKTDSVTSGIISTTDASTITIWFWVALIELFLITYLIIRLNRKRSPLKFGDILSDKIRNAQNSDVDMDNLMNSITGSKNLYKELSRTCHPDRFINSSKQNISVEIFQEISKNKRDFNKLSELKKRAIAELNINLK